MKEERKLLLGLILKGNCPKSGSCFSEKKHFIIKELILNRHQV